MNDSAEAPVALVTGGARRLGARLVRALALTGQGQLLFAVLLAIGLLAASQSGNIIRLADAHPVAICAWRLILACLVSCGPVENSVENSAGTEASPVRVEIRGVEEGSAIF